MSTRRTAVVLLLLAFALGPGVGRAGAADDPARATLKWTAKNDDGIYGYLVYRADEREGPFRRINEEIVRVSVANDAGVARYVWVDRDVVAGRTYYYYLDTLGNNGRKRRFSGVVAKTVAAR